jgi:hypothetical protein
MPAMPKPLSSAALPDWTDAQVLEALRNNANHVVYAYNDLIAELDRRAARKQARESRILSVVSVLIAVAAIIVAALKH